MKKYFVYLLLIGLYLLHNDLWLWDNPERVMGMPVGLFYHILFCAVVMAVMVLLVLWAWPASMSTDTERQERQ